MVNLNPFHPLRQALGWYRPIPKDAVAVVTGGSHGIGKAIAEEIAKRRISLLIITGRDRDALSAVQREFVDKYGVKVATIAQELNHVNSAEELYAEVKKLNVNVDVLVNNAGLAYRGPFTELTMKQIEETILTNDLTTVKLTRLIAEGMVKRKRGWILNVTSMAAYLSGPNNSIYHASKAFLSNFSFALSRELWPSNITVSQVAPGPVFETALGTRSGMEDAWGFVMSPGHLPQDIAKLAVDGLEDGRMLSLAVRHWIPVVISKVMPQVLLTYLGQAFNAAGVPQQVKEVRFQIAKHLGV